MLNTEKRKPKGDVRFNLNLNEEQKVAKQIIYETRKGSSL